MILLPPEITEKVVGNAMSGILGLTIGQELERRRFEKYNREYE